jgi:fructokinase
MTSNSPELGRDQLPGGIEGPSVVAVAGEALIDLVPAGREGLFEAVPGGSPANVAVGLARLGVPARLLARIAADPLGRRIRNHLAGNGVDLSWAVKAGEPTSLAIVAVGPDGSPEYDFRVEGTADWQWRDAELTGVLDDQVVALADVVKVSAEDLAWLLPGRPPEHVAEGWLAKGPAIVAVTLGPGGVMAVGGAGIVRRPGRRVAIVETVGAGDSFMSMLLAGLHPRGLLGVDRCAHLGAVDTDTLSAVLDEAVLASAIICTRHGVDPPTVQHLSTGRP